VRSVCVLVALLVVGGCATDDVSVADLSLYFQQAGPEEPNGEIFMPEPPASAGLKGIRVVRVSTIDGEPTPPGTDRTIRLAPGTYEVMFVRPEHRDDGIPVVMDVEVGTIYWCGWRDTEGGWEPVVYAIQEK
jgi:hypothetical protein